MVRQRLVLAGFGNIGRGLAEQIVDGHPAAKGLSISAVCDQRFGTVVAPSGIDPIALLEAAENKGSFEGLEGVAPGADVFDAIDASEADTLVEVTFTDLETGEPATSHIKHALARGMNVSTTNKGPIALHLEELEELAQANGAILAYEGTVMSGSPVILVASQSIRDAGFLGATGILNGTTNYIITRMEQGVSYDDALREAQNLGYAEDDPSGDVDGHDAAGKLSILARILVGVTIAPDDVQRDSLSILTADQVTGALKEGECWRYVAVLEKVDEKWCATVQPTRLASTHPLAAVREAANAIVFHTDLLGDVTVVGPGAGRSETAYAVLSDLRQMDKALPQ